jgi:hypothetical protein
MLSFFNPRMLASLAAVLPPTLGGCGTVIPVQDHLEGNCPHGRSIVNLVTWNAKCPTSPSRSSSGTHVSIKVLGSVHGHLDLNGGKGGRLCSRGQDACALEAMLGPATGRSI